jgi:hypothetical protein
VELSWLADRCGVHEDGLRRCLGAYSHAFVVPDDSSVQGCVIDNPRDSYGEVACGQREGMSERTGILEERLEDGLDESHGLP